MSEEIELMMRQVKLGGMASVSQEKKNQIALAFERQLNEQLFLSGAITKEMYDAAKFSLDQSAAEMESEN